VKLSYQDLDHGITCIDTFYHRPEFDGCYLLSHGSEAAIIDTGTSKNAHLIMELLQQKSIPPEQVKYIIPTHIHLDHAGGAGELMSLLPNAQLVVHPRGAAHMIEPENIIKGTVAVYGEEAFHNLYGEIRPIAADRVIETGDGLTLDLNGRKLTCLHTPGHAKHHICIWDELSKGFFTGDTFGIAYKELNTAKGAFAFLPSTPIDFDPDGWHTTLDRLMAYQPEIMYLTHYGQLREPANQADRLHRLIDTYTQIAEAATGDNRDTEISIKLQRHYIKELKLHGCELSEKEILDILGLDITLCAQGLDIWLKRRDKAAQTSN